MAGKSLTQIRGLQSAPDITPDDLMYLVDGSTSKAITVQELMNFIFGNGITLGLGEGVSKDINVSLAENLIGKLRFSQDGWQYSNDGIEFNAFGTGSSISKAVVTYEVEEIMNESGSEPTSYSYEDAGVIHTPIKFSNNLVTYNSVLNLLNTGVVVYLKFDNKLYRVSETTVDLKFSRSSNTNYESLILYSEVKTIFNSIELNYSLELMNSRYSSVTSYNDLTDKPTIPTELSQLTGDSTHRVVTDIEKNTWNGKQSAINANNKLSAEYISGLPSIPTSLSQLSEDSTHRLVTDSEKSSWSNKQDIIDSDNKLPVDFIDGIPDIPTNLSDLSEDSTHRVVTDSEKNTWNSKQDAITSSNKLSASLVEGLPAAVTSLSQLSDDSTHRLVTDDEKSTWNGKQDLIDSDNKLSYSLIGDTPSIPSKVTDLSDGSDYVKISDLVQVAKTNDYNDLDNKPLVSKIITLIKPESEEELHLVLTVSKNKDFSDPIQVVNTYSNSADRELVNIFDGNKWVNFPDEGGIGSVYDNLTISVDLNSLGTDSIYYIRYNWQIIDYEGADPRLINSDYWSMIYPSQSEVNPVGSSGSNERLINSPESVESNSVLSLDFSVTNYYKVTIGDPISELVFGGVTDGQEITIMFIGDFSKVNFSSSINFLNALPQSTGSIYNVLKLTAVEYAGSIDYIIDSFVGK